MQAKHLLRNKSCHFFYFLYYLDLENKYFCQEYMPTLVEEKELYEIVMTYVLN